MKVSNLYYRKKGKSIVIEQKIDGKSKLIKTLPNPKKLLDLLWPEASQKTQVPTLKKIKRGVPKKQASYKEDDSWIDTW